MASFRKTFYTTLSMVILVGLIAGGVYGWNLWQAHQRQQRFNQAVALLEDGQPDEANQMLAQLMAESSASSPWAADALAYRLRALEELEDDQSLRQLAEKVLDSERPRAREGSEAWARAQLALGDAALEARNIEEARRRFNLLAVQAEGAFGRREARYGLARIELAQADSVEQGRNRMQELVDSLPEGDPVREKAEQQLGQINMKMLMTPQPFGEDQIYVIERGDTIAGIAKKFGVSPDLLMAVNNISDPRLLTIGRRMKIPDLDLSIAVNKTDNVLTLYNDGKFFKQYPVRTGQYDYMTPTGQFHVGRKNPNPTWTDPKTRQVYGPGEEGNELGARWMGFRENPSIGIHEAVDPSTVGQYGSNGCVGLRYEDIVELYDLVSIGTPVTIKGSTPQDQSLKGNEL